MGTIYLKPAQRKQAEQELDNLKKVVEAPEVPGLPIDKDSAKIQLRKTQEFLVKGTPPPTSPQRRQELMKEISTLEGEIRDGMPTKMHMERGAPGVIDQNLRWGKANTHRVSHWKDCLRELEPDNLDPDLSNIERIRPMGRADEAVPRKVYTGVDIVEGEIIHEGISDAQKIEAVTGGGIGQSIGAALDPDMTLVEEPTPSTVAEWVGEPEVAPKPEPTPASCDVCGEVFEKGWRAVGSHKRFSKVCSPPKE